MYSRGTSGYRAPELINEFSEKRTYNNKVDIFAIGCIFYELVTGQKAFVSDFAVLQAYSSRDPKIAFPVKKHLPSWERVEATGLIRQMLDMDPCKRPKAIHLYREFLVGFAQHSAIESLKIEASELASHIIIR